MNIFKNKRSSRIRRSLKMRCNLKNLNVMRLVVHRTARHIYAQIINTKTSMVLTAASTLEKNIRNKLSSYTGNKESASFIGSEIAQRALNKGIYSVVFDRSGFKYHGRVKTLAEAARNSGLKF